MRTLSAAVLHHADPRAAEAARVVPPKAKIIKHGDCVAGYVHRPTKTGRPVPLHALRRSQFNRLVVDRYQDAPPNPSEARNLAHVFSDHASFDEATRWVDKWCITIDQDERDEIIEQSFEHPTYWSADDLALLLGVTKDERNRLRLTTIGAVDQTKRQRTIARKVANRERMHAARAAAQTIKEISQEKATPWREAGVSRRTWFRKKKAACNIRDTKAVFTNEERLLHTEPVPRRVATFGATSADRVLLAIRDGGPISVAAIAAQTGLHHRVVRPVLSRLLKSEKIARVSRGVYRAGEPEGSVTAQSESPLRPAPARLGVQRTAPKRASGVAMASMRGPRPVRFCSGPPGHAGRGTAGFEQIYMKTIGASVSERATDFEVVR